MFCIFEIAMLVMGIVIVSKGEIRMGGKVCRGLPAYAVDAKQSKPEDAKLSKPEDLKPMQMWGGGGGG